MPKIERWDNLPSNIRSHLVDRMRDRSISIADLNQFRLWIESQPEVPEGDWYKDFGSSNSVDAALIRRLSCFLAKSRRARLFE